MQSTATSLKPEFYSVQDGSMDEISDAFETLVQKSMLGEKDALYELCGSMAREVLFRTKYILNNKTDAEDVAQEVMIRVCKSITNLRDAKCFKAWLSSIISNEINRHMLQNKTRGVVLNIEDYSEAIADEAEDASPQRSVESKEDHSELMKIISSLSTRQREIIMMHYYDGISVAESAKILGIARQNAAANLMRGRENIKLQLMKNNRMSAYSAMPIGTFLSWAFQQENSLYGIANETAFLNVMKICNEYLQTGNEATAVAPTAIKLFRKLWVDIILGACVAAAVAIAVLVFAGME